MNETRSCSVGSLQITARGADLFRYPDKEEAQGKKGKKDRQRRRANRDARNHDLLAKLEVAAASPSRAPMEDQAEEPQPTRHQRLGQQRELRHCDALLWHCSELIKPWHYSELNNALRRSMLSAAASSLATSIP